MKTITMDYDTYKKECENSENELTAAFDRGSRTENMRLEPILDELRRVICLGGAEFDAGKIKLLMRKAGEI